MANAFASSSYHVT